MRDAIENVVFVAVENAVSVVFAAKNGVENKLAHRVGEIGSAVLVVVDSDFASKDVNVVEFATSIEGTKFGEMTRVKLKQFGVCHKEIPLSNMV